MRSNVILFAVLTLMLGLALVLFTPGVLPPAPTPTLHTPEE
jgi:hypothetical protein